MSDLTNIDKLKLEIFFGMSSGYVLDFSNRTFQEFIYDSVNLDIYDNKYSYASGSKANRLRAFWNKEPNHYVAKLISDLLEYWSTQKVITYEEIIQSEQALFDECEKIVERLKEGSPVNDVEVFQSYSSVQGFKLLATSIKESIQKNEPELALDRLHTLDSWSNPKNFPGNLSVKPNPEEFNDSTPTIVDIERLRGLYTKHVSDSKKDRS